MIAYTPTPWYADEYDIRADDGAGLCIAVTPFGANDALQAEAKANAAHIVKCVNHFDDLVAALEGAIGACDHLAGCLGESRATGDRMDNARAILGKVSK